MEDTVETVCRAIAVLYGAGPDSQQAQQYLTAFQEAQESWIICDQIIGRHTDSTACFFAAQTLRTKISKRFKQLLPEEYELLRQSLLQHLNRHGASVHDQLSEATSTQLCLAIADLYIQVPIWNNWIFELLTQCQSLEGDRTIMTLTLLQVFPEEVEQIQGVGENRRNMIRNELADCETSMVTFLSHVVSKFHHDAGVMKKVLKCLESNLGNKAMKTDSFAESPLIATVFHIVSSQQVSSCIHEAATNAIVAALIRVEEVEKHLKLAKVLQCGVVQLVDAFKVAEEMEDFDRLQNLSRIFVEMCESFYYQIVTDAHPEPNSVGSLACLELLLLVASNHDYVLIEMTFNVWYRITEELFKYDDDMYIAKFRPYADKFIMALYAHCKFDSDDVNEVPDERNEFGEFRSKAAEAVRDVVFVVNTDHCINTMYHKLVECSQNPNSSWEDTESALFIMACVVQNLLPESDGVMPEVMKSIVSIPVASPPALIITCLALIGDCNDWLEQRSNLLGPILKWILQFAIDTRYSFYVAECLDRITVKCAADMIGFLGDLISLISVLEHSTQNGMKVEAAINSIIRAASLIITKLQPSEAKIAMEKLCEPIIKNLNKAIEITASNGLTASGSTVPNNNLNNNNNNGADAPVPAVPNGSNKENEIHNSSSQSWAAISNRPIIWIDRIASVFKDVWKPPSMSEPPPQIHWLNIAEEFFKALLICLKKFESNERIVEHAIRSIRFLFRSLGGHSMRFVEPSVHMMIDIFPNRKHSCILYMAAIIVDQYGHIDAMRPGLLQMLEVLTNATFETLNQPNGCVDHPDMVDDLFRMAHRFTTRATTPFFIHPISTLLFKCAIANLQLNHPDGNASVTRFLNEVIDQLKKAKDNKYSDEGVVIAQTLVASHGQTLVSATLQAALFHLTGRLVRDMAEIIYNVGKLNKEKQKEWLIGAVESLPNQPMKATPEQLSQFVSDCVKEKDAYSVHQHVRTLIQLFA